MKARINFKVNIIIKILRKLVTKNILLDLNIRCSHKFKTKIKLFFIPFLRSFNRNLRMHYQLLNTFLEIIVKPEQAKIEGNFPLESSRNLIRFNSYFIGSVVKPYSWVISTCISVGLSSNSTRSKVEKVLYVLSHFSKYTWSRSTSLKLLIKRGHLALFDLCELHLSP